MSRPHRDPRRVRHGPQPPDHRRDGRQERHRRQHERARRAVAPALQAARAPSQADRRHLQSGPDRLPGEAGRGGGPRGGPAARRPRDQLLQGGGGRAGVVPGRRSTRCGSCPTRRSFPRPWSSRCSCTPTAEKIPVLGLSERHAQMGALLSLSFGSSEDIGRQAGELARAVLSGKAPADLPYTTARKVSLIVNLKAAQKLGMEVPDARPRARHQRDPVMRGGGARSAPTVSRLLHFGARVFWSVVPIVVILLIVHGWINVREHRRLVTEEFDEAGRRPRLQPRIDHRARGLQRGPAAPRGRHSRGALRDPDVGYVVILATTGSPRRRRPAGQRGRGASEKAGRPPGLATRRARRRAVHRVPGADPGRGGQDAGRAPRSAARARSGEGATHEVIGGLRLGMGLERVARQSGDLPALGRHHPGLPDPERAGHLRVLAADHQRPSSGSPSRRRRSPPASSTSRSRSGRGTRSASSPSPSTR